MRMQRTHPTTQHANINVNPSANQLTLNSTFTTCHPNYSVFDHCFVAGFVLDNAALSGSMSLNMYLKKSKSFCLLESKQEVLPCVTVAVQRYPLAFFHYRKVEIRKRNVNWYPFSECA